MPNSLNSLTEYLVKVGWDVDELGLKSALNKVDSFKSTFVKSLVNISSAAVELVSKTADIDLGTERMARRFWISESAARSLSTSLDALGISYEDLFYATDEQYERFLNLNNYARQLESQSTVDVDKTLVQIRDIQYEFSKLKVLFSYFTREVVGYIGKYNDLVEIKEDLNDVVILAERYLPKIADWVAKVFSWVWKLGSTGLKTVYSLLKSIVNILGTDGVAAIGLFGGAIKLLKSGPLGWLIFGLTSLILLIEDFMTWKAGGKSALSQLWEELEDNGALQALGETLGEVKELATDIVGLLKDVGGATFDLIDAFAELLGYDNGWDLLADAIKVSLDIIRGIAVLTSAAINGVSAAIDLLLGKYDSAKEKINKIGDKIYDYADSIGLGDLFYFLSPEFRGISNAIQSGNSEVTEGNENTKNTGVVNNAINKYASSLDSDVVNTSINQLRRNSITKNPITDLAEWIKLFLKKSEETSYVPQGAYYSGNSTYTTNNSTNTMNVNVNVEANGTNDPKEVASETSRAVSDMLKNRPWQSIFG